MKQNHRIRIDCLTPLHIGSGKEPASGIEYVVFDRMNVAIPISESKVLELIGLENLATWVSHVEKGTDLMPYLKTRKPDLTPSDIGIYQIPLADPGLPRALSYRAMIRDGLGRPYLPGSSLKGSFRTSIFSSELSERARNTGNGQIHLNKIKNFNKYSSKKLEMDVFGLNPYQDVFRFVSITDAVFKKTVMHRVDIHSLTRQGWIVKKQNTSFAECIPAGETAETIIQTGWYENDSVLNITKSAIPNFEKLGRKMSTARLLNEANKSCRVWLVNEIDFWQNKEGDGIPEDYIEALENLLETCKLSISGTEAVVRCGFGSGWKSITGEWQDHLLTGNDFRDLRIHVQSNKHYPADWPTPKTRKLTAGGLPFGFLKLIMSQ